MATKAKMWMCVGIALSVGSVCGLLELLIPHDEESFTGWTIFLHGLMPIILMIGAIAPMIVASGYLTKLQRSNDEKV